MDCYNERLKLFSLRDQKYSFTRVKRTHEISRHLVQHLYIKFIQDSVECNTLVYLIITAHILLLGIHNTSGGTCNKFQPVGTRLELLVSESESSVWSYRDI